MRKTLTLEELGRRLGMVDQHIIALLSKRMELAREVERTKRISNDPLLRKTVEEKRLEAARNLADQEGLDRNFIHAIFYLIIAETCRVEIDQLQARPILEELSPERLRENLLALTEAIAPYYDAVYGADFFATSSYLAFEDGVLSREIETLKGCGNASLAIDLGCATGRVAFKLAESFERVKGYDISPAMIEQAEAKRKNAQEKLSGLEFMVADIERIIPEATNSASFVVMNLGTAGDIVDIRRVLVAIKRILKPDGRFFLSFYNAGSLLNKCWFIPWPVSLVARINPLEHCLDVRMGNRVFSIPARSYTVREVKKMLLQNGLTNFQIVTYPTMSSILPKEFFDKEDMKRFIEEIDLKLTGFDTGAYILVTGRKTS